MMRSVILGAALTLAVATGVHAEPASHETFSDVEIVGPESISDLSCFEGREFTVTGTIAREGRSTQNSGEAFHFALTETWDLTFVPTDGLGPTYVEHAVERVSFNANEHNTVFNLTVPFHDTLVAHDADGNRIPGQTIRIHGVSRLLAEDKDATPPEGRIKVDLERVRIDCP